MFVVNPRKPTHAVLGSVEPPDQQSFLLWIMEMHGEKLRLFINSPGGDVPTGLCMAEAVQAHDNVLVVANTMVDSMAVAVFAAAKVRLAFRRTYFLVHPFRGGQAGTEEQLAMEAERLRRWKDQYNTVLSDGSSRPLKFWADLTSRESPFSASDARAWGLVNDVVDSWADVETKS